MSSTSHNADDDRHNRPSITLTDLFMSTYPHPLHAQHAQYLKMFILGQIPGSLRPAPPPTPSEGPMRGEGINDLALLALQSSQLVPNLVRSPHQQSSLPYFRLKIG